jgi:hypothetical protein
MSRWQPLVAVLAVLSLSCATRQPVASLPFPKLPPIPGDGIDLLPLMELRIENAYYPEGAPKHGMDGFLGTEVARYRVATDIGLQLISTQPLPVQRPADQLSAEELISSQHKRYRHYRLYRAIIFSQRRGIHSPVLLGTDTVEQLYSLSEQLLSEPERVCNSESDHCTVFPEACSVAIEMEVVVNGAPRTFLWGDRLWAITGRDPNRVEVVRYLDGTSAKVNLDLSDPTAIQAPLYPGDQVTWD